LTGFLGKNADLLISGFIAVEASVVGAAESILAFLVPIGICPFDRAW
jgi:hypothetical protein